MNNKSTNLSKLYGNLISEGIIMAKNGHYEKSEKIFFQAIKINDTVSDAFINLSNVFILNNKLSKALSLLKNFNDKYKYNVSVLNHFFNICKKYKLDDEIYLYLTKLEKKNDTNFDNTYFLFFLLGKYYEKNNNTTLSIKYFKKSIANNKFYDGSYIGLLDGLERLNKIDELDKILKLYKKNNKNLNEKVQFFECLLLARRNKHNESEKKIKEYKLDNIFENNDDYYFLKTLNLKSKNNEILKNYLIAFKSIEKRNNLLRKINNLNNIKKENLDLTLKNYKEIYNKKNISDIFKRIGNLKHKNINIAFLVGFPRSGTTLLDTILRTHSHIHVLEEKPYLPNCRQKFFGKKKNDLNSITRIKKEEIIEIRNYYLDQIKESNTKQKELIIDKIPLTITELGFVKIIFPEAKIILALRHPCDVVLSCFFTNFKPNEAMINFLQWEDTIKFYDKVFTLFEFYQENLDLNIMSIKYEDIVFEFEANIKKLLIFLNLNFEQKLKKFYITAKNRTKISTPSYNQVTNPLYSTSIGRWKHYKGQINLELKLKDWIKKFNY